MYTKDHCGEAHIFKLKGQHGCVRSVRSPFVKTKQKYNYIWSARFIGQNSKLHNQDGNSVTRNHGQDCVGGWETFCPGIYVVHFARRPLSFLPFRPHYFPARPNLRSAREGERGRERSRSDVTVTGS